MPTPQLPGFGDASAFTRWTKSIDYRLNLLFEKLNNVLANTGLSIPSPGVTQVDGTLNVLGTQNVSGTLNVSGNETVGGTLNVTGNTVIGGTLSLPNGIINNAALANPTAFGFGGNSSTGFAISTSSTAKSSVNIPVPTGFTQALIHCTVNGSAQNSTASSDFLFVSAHITMPSGDFGAGGEAFSGVAAGGWGNAAASAAGSFTSIGTGNITVSCMIRTGTAWGATGANIANVDATVTFLR
jgi:hypothetical protein